MVSESWLKSDDHDKFAKAAIRCQHAGAFCVADGYCHYEGQCFRSEACTVNRARKIIEFAALEQPPDIASKLRLAADLLRATMSNSTSTNL